MKRRYLKKEVRRKTIIEAASKVIIKYGSENVTVKSIARELDLSDQAIYRHFNSKNELLLFLIDHIEYLLIKDINEATTSTNSSAIKTIEKILLSNTTTTKQGKGISFQVIAEIVSLGDKTLNKRIIVMIQKYITHLSNILNHGISLGEIRKDINVESAAIILFSIIQGLINLRTLSNYKFVPRKKIDALWQIYCHSIEIVN